MVIAGAALIKGAKSQHLSSLDIGGPEVHVHQSGCADQRVPDDEVALQMHPPRRRAARDELRRSKYYRHGAGRRLRRTSTRARTEAGPDSRPITA